MAYKNRENQLACQRRHYLRNKEQRLLLNIKRAKEAKELVNSIKSSGCILCEEKDIVCLDFHHLDPKIKDMSLSKACNSGWSNERILKEIKKCVILCSNCHRKVEAGTLTIE